MKYNVNIIKKEDYKVSNWSGGKTTEMYIYPEDSDYKKRDFYFRISSASVELSESDFTKLEGVDRWITTLDGDLKLSHDYKNFIKLKPFETYEFKGDIETHSYGKVEDFNLMLANGAKGELESIAFNEKKTINICGEDKQYDFNVFYSPDSDVSIFIENEKTCLKKGDLLVIKVENNLKERKGLSIKLLAKGKINMLYSKIKKK